MISLDLGSPERKRADQKIKNDRVKITTNTTEIQKVI